MTAMVRFQTVLIFFLTGCLMAACGVVPRSAQPPGGTVSSVGTSFPGPNEDDSQPPPSIMAVSSLDEAKVILMQAYRDWKGTPYLLGGTTQMGVDCSKLVNIIFEDYFGIDLPTNTKTQLNAGDGIRRSAVRTGDLVFFRTGRKTLHVGIAVNSGEFIHASTSNGVMISKLGNRYWRNRFLAARRIL